MSLCVATLPSLPVFLPTSVLRSERRPRASLVAPAAAVSSRRQAPVTQKSTAAGRKRRKSSPRREGAAEHASPRSSSQKTRSKKAPPPAAEAHLVAASKGFPLGKPKKLEVDEDVGDAGDEETVSVLEQTGVDGDDSDQVQAESDADQSSRRRAAAGKGQQRAKRGENYTDSLKMYLDEIRRYELLQHTDELDLARQVSEQLHIERERRLLERKLRRRPTAKEWAEQCEMSVPVLQRRIFEGTRAKQRLVTANLRLVNTLVNKYRRRGGTSGASIPMQDLLQEGVFGLLRAAEKYDSSKGYRFSTYATYWITSFIARAAQQLDRSVRLPQHLHEIYSKMRSMHRQYMREYGEAPSEAKLAEMSGVTVAKLRFCMQSVHKQTVSLDVSLRSNSEGGDDSGATIADMLESEEDVDERVVNNMFRMDLDRTLRRHLNPRERAALRLRFGLDGGGERTLKDISKSLKLSRERTRQIIFSALIKLRHRDVQSELEDYMPDLFRHATKLYDENDTDEP